MSVKSAIIIFAILFSISVNTADAVQLDVKILDKSEEIIPKYQFTKIIHIFHDENSELKRIIGDAQRNIEFDINLENSKTLIDSLNEQLIKKSFVVVTDITGKYSATISPQKEFTSIEYTMVIEPTIKNHFVKDSTFLDSQWRGFLIEGPVLINTKYGMYDINRAISALNQIPELEQFMAKTDSIAILESDMIDAQGLTDLPLSKWESIFDPTSRMIEAKEYGFKGSVLTNYSMGICTVYLGVCQDNELQETFHIDNEEYSIRSIESQDDGTIIIEGYVKNQYVGNAEMFVIQESAQIKEDEDDTKVPTLYALSGIGIALAVSFFVWSDRKTKKTSSEQTGIDPKHLSAVAITSAAGSYQTNRGTAELSN